MYWPTYFLTYVLREKSDLGELWDVICPFKIYEKDEITRKNIGKMEGTHQFRLRR